MISFCLVLFLAPASVHAATIELGNDENIVDGRLRDGANTRYGGQIKWDISSIPDFQQVDSATACGWLWDQSGTLDADITIYRVNDQAWTSTYDASAVNSQSLDTQIDTTLSSTAANSWGCFDVTDIIDKDYKAGNTYSTIRWESTDYPLGTISAISWNSELEIGASGAYSAINSEENQAGNGNTPKLTITYSEAPVTPVEISLYLNGTAENKEITYGDSVNITATLNTTGIPVSLYLNSSLINLGITRVENITFGGWFGGGVWNITALWAGNDTYSSAFKTLFLTVNKASSNLHIALNNTEADRTFTWPQAENITTWADLSGGTVTLKRNGTDVTSEYVDILGGGVYNFTASLSHQNYTAEPVERTVIVKKSYMDITQSASPGWDIGENTQITITVTAVNGTYFFYRDGISITSPYTATLPFGIYNFTLEPPNTQNYTITANTRWLTVSSGGFGCTNPFVLAFQKTFPGGGNITLNFTELVESNLVREDMADVWLSDTVNGWRNIDSGKYYIIVNASHVDTFEVKFGNYIGNSTWVNQTGTPNATAITSYTQVYPYYVFTFLEETDSTQQLPQDSNRTLSLYCSDGISSFGVNHSKLMVASLSTLSEAKTTIAYSSTEIYSRNVILDSTSTTEYKNVYLVDAGENQVVQMLLKLQDNTGSFSDPTLKIKKYMGGTLQTITEHHFDSENKAIVYLINNDKYYVYVENGDEERGIGYLYIDTTDLDKTIVIGDISATNMTYGNISFSLGWSDSSIVFSWLDPSGETEQIELWIYNYTNQTQVFYYGSSTNHSSIEFTYLAPDLNQTYTVRYKISHNIFGTSTTDNIVHLLGPGFIPTVAFPLLTLITALGGAGGVWLVLLFIMPLGMAFPTKHLAVGLFSVIGVVALLAAMGQYTVAGMVIGISIFLVVLMEIQIRRRTGE